MRIKEYPLTGEAIEREQMENGLTVLVDRKVGFHKSTAFFATNYGGADRRFRLGGKWLDTPAGIAHFLEHKMFDMPDYDALMALSANGASANAFTSSFLTAYYFNGTEKFTENLKILLDFVSTPYFSEKSIAKEQEIIGQEIRMTEDQPDSVLYYGLLKCLYSEHPVRDSVAGTVESIAQITPQTLYDCHKVFYNPSNMVLCVCGDQDIRKITELAREILPREAGEVPMRDYGKTDSMAAVTKKTAKNMEVGMPMFMAGVKMNAAVSGQEALRQQVTADMALKAFLGTSSPLYAGLYRDGLVNSSFFAEPELGSQAAYSIFGGESRDPDAVCGEVLRAAEKLGKDGMDPALFNRVKKSVMGNELRGLDSFDDVCYNMAVGHFRGYDPFEAYEMAGSVTAEDAAAFLTAHLTEENLAMSLVSRTC